MRCVRCDYRKTRHEYYEILRYCEHARAVNTAERIGKFDATTKQDLGIMSVQGYGTRQKERRRLMQQQSTKICI